jgi:hypothetical protein
MVFTAEDAYTYSIAEEVLLMSALNISSARKKFRKAMASVACAYGLIEPV